MAVAVGSLFDRGRTTISWHARGLTGGRNLVEEPFLYFIISFLFFLPPPPPFFLGLGRWKGGYRDRKGVGHGRRLSIIFKAAGRQRMGFLCRLRIGFVCGQPYYLHTFLLVLDLLFYFASYTGDYWGLLCYGKAGVCRFSMSSFHFIFSFFLGGSIWGLKAALISCYFFFFLCFHFFLRVSGGFLFLFRVFFIWFVLLGNYRHFHARLSFACDFNLRLRLSFQKHTGGGCPALSRRVPAPSVRI